MSGGLKQDISVGGNLQALRKRAGFTQETASAKLELLGLTITPEMVGSIRSMSEYTFSEDIGDMIDTLIRLSYEDSLDDNETMNKIRTMSCVRDFLRDIEKSRSRA